MCWRWQRRCAPKLLPVDSHFTISFGVHHSLSSVPMVEVALCPADSLNTAQCRRRGDEVVPWQGASMAFSYFDSINSEQLWQRHSSTGTTGDSLEQY
ncbi:Hypothetical predicted protein [Cloeon dipterum]|uniref:Uncharacterized protein n=1 Tax=Cloeon dipterum TaxID=197152 RepID=A0A8S1DLU8_9INSE|nr:Hypothetical predicted protein [Cloeon dipterum]